MNPGPAPRPPADHRPRLNLTPAVANIPGNVPAIPLPNRGSSGSLSRLTDREGSGGALAVVKEGPARVKEEGLLRGVFWSEKWLILRETQLDFHKTQSSPKISFSIALKDVTTVNRCDTAPMSFEILRLTNPGSGVSSSATASSAKDLTKTVICRVDTDSEVYSWIDEIYARCPAGGVSNPTNFAHQVHVGYDPTSGTFVGLPPEWERLLNNSAITKEDYKENPTAVIEVLNFYSDYRQVVGASPNSRIPAASTAVSPPRQGKQNGSTRDKGYEALSKSRTQSAEQITPINDSPMSAYSPSPMDARLEMDRRRKMDDEVRREQYKKEQRERYREKERRDREELAASQSALPQMRTATSRSDLTVPRGGGAAAGDYRENGYHGSPNPARPGLTSSPSRDQHQGSSRQMVAHRLAPSAPAASNGSPQQVPKKSSPYKDNTSSPARYQESPVSKPMVQEPNGQSTRFPVNITKPTLAAAAVASPTSAVASAMAARAPKPLNVTVRQPTGPAAVAEAATRAEQEPPRQKTPVSYTHLTLPTIYSV